MNQENKLRKGPSREHDDNLVQARRSGASNRHDSRTPLGKGDDRLNSSQDQEAMELAARVGAQKEEILILRQQIDAARIKELQLLNEKYALERKFSDLRMAIDEKQNEAIASALNELTRRRGGLEENLKLANDLKVAEDERYIFTSSILRILADYGVWPHAISASAISSSVKILYDQLQWSTSHVQGQMDTSPTLHIDEQPIIPVDKMSRDVVGSTHQNLTDRGLMGVRNGNMPTNSVDLPPSSHDEAPPIVSKEEGPAIESFRIVGDAFPGGKLLGCGYPVRGTTLCMFQWVHHLADGRTQYIKGATNPDYVVTADDVDKRIAVECIPMDDKGRQVHIDIFGWFFVFTPTRSCT